MSQAGHNFAAENPKILIKGKNSKHAIAKTNLHAKDVVVAKDLVRVLAQHHRSICFVTSLNRKNENLRPSKQIPALPCCFKAYVVSGAREGLVCSNV